MDDANRTPPLIWSRAKRAADQVFVEEFMKHQLHKRLVAKKQREARALRDKQEADALRRQRMAVFTQLLFSVRNGSRFSDDLMIAGLMDMAQHLSWNLTTRERRSVKRHLRDLGLLLVSGSRVKPHREFARRV
jgi:hypothetical protein